MAIYKKFTGDQDNEDLLKKHLNSGNISQIAIACIHDTVDLIVDRLYIDDGTTEYDIIANVRIPVGVTLVLDHDLSYSSKLFDLRITTTNSSNCTVIIK